MADFFFFTDIDKIKTQTAGQNFGIVNSADPDYDVNKERFRLTSTHTSTGDSNVYAICDADVFVIEDQTNPNLLNMVLKPYDQPVQGLPKIKYYIYKGINKNSLITGANIADPSAAISNNKLTQRLWDSEANPSSNAILPKVGFDVTHKIYTTFYKSDPTNTQSQLPKVKAGEKIGTFNAAGFGLEIITDDVDTLHEEVVGTNTLNYSDPSYRYVKQAVNYVEVNNSMSVDAQNDFFLKRNIKERILRYIDPCAFWGSFFDSKLLYKDSTEAESTADGNEVYKEILYGTTANAPLFINRNRVYIDIRNDLNYSYDFFNNYQEYNFTSSSYTNFIKAAFDSTSAFGAYSNFDYYRSAWPIIILENDYPVNNTVNPNIFQLSLPKGDNDSPILFISKANIALKKRFKFSSKKRLEYIDYTNSLNTYSETLNITLNNFYDTAIPNTTANAWNISNYYKLKLLKQIAECPILPSSGTVIRRAY